MERINRSIRLLYLLNAVLICIALFICSAAEADSWEDFDTELIGIGSSPYFLTGLTIDRNGRILICSPDWGLGIPFSVAELKNDSLVPWPDSSWNSWDGTLPAGNSFTCVQSLYTDFDGLIWVLDTGNPGLAGPLEGAARLFSFDPEADTLLSEFRFESPVIGDNSYIHEEVYLGNVVMQ